MTHTKTVFVGLSGGVDSSVAALRLKQQGYRVVGVFIKVWHPDFMVCNWEQERLDAMRVAAHLGIPFLTCDAEAAYKNGVADYFVSEYKAGRTPNPDILCNREIKFGAFLDFAKTHGADFVATGHYARRIDVDEQATLHRGVDESKDQSYFLWTLTGEQLNKTLFPIGDTTKGNIRKEARRTGITTAAKKDSQGICFLGHVDIPEFLSHYVDLTPGDVLNSDGQVIGTHVGALVYTVGQRHGFTLHTSDTARSSQYVVTKDIERNTITVAPTRPHLKSHTHVVLSQSVVREKVQVSEEIDAQFRYRQSPFRVKVLEIKTDSLVIEPIDSVETPAVGQSCVLYRGSLCLGGGIIS